MCQIFKKLPKRFFWCQMSSKVKLCLEFSTKSANIAPSNAVSIYSNVIALNSLLVNVIIMFLLCYFPTEIEVFNH